MTTLGLSKNNRQDDLDACLDLIYEVLNESKLSLDELFFVLGELLISTGINMGAAQVDINSFNEALAGVPSPNLAMWLRNTGLLVLSQIGHMKKKGDEKSEESNSS